MISQIAMTSCRQHGEEHGADTLARSSIKDWKSHWILHLQLDWDHSRCSYHIYFPFPGKISMARRDKKSLSKSRARCLWHSARNPWLIRRIVVVKCHILFLRKQINSQIHNIRDMIFSLFSILPQPKPVRTVLISDCP